MSYRTYFGIPCFMLEDAEISSAGEKTTPLALASGVVVHNGFVFQHSEMLVTILLHAL
ncbi:MAG: hypothetical protein FWG85_07855 [Bacteroidetes bacterium]|nr:hypothetical protein [Bacteroidota bacterium]